MSKAIEHKIEKFIHEYNLLENGDNLIVGVSGGADSMMLLHFLYKHQAYYNIQINVAHVHHGVRAEAEEDAQLVEDTCKEWKLPYYRHDCDIKWIAKSKSISEEEAGRIERYNFFISLSNNSSKIVTAHNMNDQAETLIMRFLRGTELKGLGGIPPKRDNIIRPLLCLKRTEIEKYCDSNNVIYRDDHTNFMPIYTRNKIRLECIPYIENNINSNIINLLGEHSHFYREGEDFLRTYTKELFDRCAKKTEKGICIDILEFGNCHKYIKTRIIMLAIELLTGTTKDIALKHLESVIGLAELQSGKKVSLPYNIIAYKQYHEIIIGCEKQNNIFYQHNIDLGIKEIPELKCSVALTLVDKETIKQKNEKMYTKYIDYDKIKVGLQIRTRLPYDYIVTKEGTKKIKKLFIDDKFPKDIRDNVPLIADGGEIIWIVGGRLNTDYYITDNTKKVLEIRMNFE